jgi:hypothetical protein
MKKLSICEFKKSFAGAEPPEGLTIHAKALWFAGKGDWERAHDIVQDLPDQFSSHIHAFLHRQEGDLSNARYWYSKAGAQVPSVSLDQEWEELAALILG